MSHSNLSYSATRKERIQRFVDAVDIYPVTCGPLSNGRSDEEILRAVIAGGASIIQLRDKEASKRELLAKAAAFRAITRENDVLFIINDHIDIALAVDADGVHLGQNDFPLAEARKLLPGQILGISTHNGEQALEAQTSGADYVNIGPIFATATKEKAHSPVGCAMIRLIAPNLSIPFTVMGGITPDNLDQVLAAGANKIAVVTAITKAANPAAATRALKDRIRSYHS